MERVIAKDGPSGEWVEVSVIVRVRYWLAVSCACWNHRLPHRLEMITSSGSIFFRPADSDELFREIGHKGPISIECERSIRESRSGE
jgi:hypothetical protein